MICPACKESFLKEVEVIDDAELKGFSLTPSGFGSHGVVKASHTALYCVKEKREIARGKTR